MKNQEVNPKPKWPILEQNQGFNQQLFPATQGCSPLFPHAVAPETGNELQFQGHGHGFQPPACPLPRKSTSVLVPGCPRSPPSFSLTPPVRVLRLPSLRAALRKGGDGRGLRAELPTEVLKLSSLGSVQTQCSTNSRSSKEETWPRQRSGGEKESHDWTRDTNS